MKKLTWVPLFLLLAVSVVPVVAQDEDGPKPLTWLAFSKVHSGMMEEAVAMTLEESEVMQGLIDDGTIASWGLATPINHRPGDAWNLVEWVTVQDWEQVDAWVGAVMARMQTLDEATRKEREARAKEIWVEGSHHDEVVRQVVFNPGDPSNLRYFYIADFHARPGKGEEVVKFFQSTVAPTLDELVASGAMTSYGVQVPELHMVADWSMRFWYGLPDLAGISAMMGALQGASTPASNAWMRSLFEMEGHYDKVLLVMHHVEAAPE